MGHICRTDLGSLILSHTHIQNSCCNKQSKHQSSQLAFHSKSQSLRSTEQILPRPHASEAVVAGPKPCWSYTRRRESSWWWHDTNKLSSGQVRLALLNWQTLPTSMSTALCKPFVCPGFNFTGVNSIPPRRAWKVATVPDATHEGRTNRKAEADDIWW